MDSQTKQKATYDVQVKFREFYPGDRILEKDLRRENTWWPGSVAERSRPKSNVVVLDDWRVWKRHLDHIRRDSMDSAVPQPNVTREQQDSVLDPPSHVPLGTDVPLTPQVPSDNPVMDPAQSETEVPLEKEESVPVTEKSPTVDTRSSEVGQTPLRRSSRVCKAPDRLIETV